MMMVSTNKYVVYTWYEMTMININFIILFPKELLICWAQDAYRFS